MSCLRRTIEDVELLELIVNERDWQNSMGDFWSNIEAKAFKEFKKEYKQEKKEQRMAKEHLKEPGIYQALIINAEATKSKKGDDMLVVTFKEIGGKSGGEINSYFVPKYDFMAKKLAELKLAVGVSPAAKKEELLGKKLMIGVRIQEVKPGKERINEKTGQPYPPSSEVFEFGPLQNDSVSISSDADKLPF